MIKYTGCTVCFFIVLAVKEKGDAGNKKKSIRK